MSTNIVVLKFGSSVLRSPADFPAAVHEIYRWYRAGHQVLVVVSAVGDSTETLLASGQALAAGDWSAIGATPDPHAQAELLATGERSSAALMGIALTRAGIPSRLVDPREVRLIADGSPLDSEPRSVEAARLRALFLLTPVLVVPGFFSIGADERLHLLGRGGSDLTAVFLAHALDAQRCRLIKDVEGVYERDPAAVASSTANRPHRYATLTYAQAIERAAQLVQPKAVRFLEHHRRAAEVAALGRAYESVIGPHDSKFCDFPIRPPLKVALMGLGTVGFGVYQQLSAMKQDFEITAILVRDRKKYESRGVPKHLLFDDITGFGGRLLRNRPDAVVDALCGLQPSLRLATAFLHAGISVVTANKALVAETGPALDLLATRVNKPNADEIGCRFLYSASVGASTPMIPAIRRAVSIRAIAAVLNGTCNFVLNRAADGATFQEALRDAREMGLTEADPSDDLSARDAARKLRILVRHAYGRDIDSDRIDVEPVDVTTFARARQAKNAGLALRLVATAERTSREFLRAQVRLEALAPDHPLADIPGEWNRIVVEHADGGVTVATGRGAGRWPTTEAILADLFEIHRGECHER